MKGSSEELQKISLSLLIKDQYLFTKCMSSINESYFTSSSYKLIYKCLKIYYNKYMSNPMINEISLLVKENYKEEYGTLDSILKDLIELYGDNVSSEEFAQDKLVEFIRRNKIEKSLERVLEYVSNGNIDLEKVGDDLSDCINISLRKTNIHSLSETSDLKDIKKEALGSVDNPIVVKLFLKSMNKLFQYGGLIPGTVNQIIGAPGNGKTSLAINQGVCTAQQGYNVLHVFLGDMSNWDGTLRYLSCFTGVETSKLVKLSEQDNGLENFIKKYNMTGVLGLIDIMSFAAHELNINALIEEIKNAQKQQNKHYDAIIIDYDENIEKSNESMYEEGGEVFNKMALFSVLNTSVVFILSQPKPSYWNKEILTLESSAESSKKGKIVDFLLTLGKPSRESTVGTAFIGKNRRGIDGKCVRVQFLGDRCQIKEITDDQYNQIKQSEKYVGGE